jgi:hypothetical protein
MSNGNFTIPDNVDVTILPPPLKGGSQGLEPAVTGANLSRGDGIAGFSEAGPGVHGESKGGNGILGVGAFNGVVGQTNAAEHSGILGMHSGGGRAVTGVSDAAGGIGVHGKGARLAGFFEGDVEVTGDVRLTNADCAEYFDVAETERIEPGTVMVIDETGALQQCQQSYDRRAAGVVSGAGGYKPAIVLDKQGSEGTNRLPIALLGKVCCKVDARYAPIEIGDLLTTSPNRGHAMKATDPLKAFGAVIGKALRPVKTGQETIPILIALQ